MQKQTKLLNVSLTAQAAAEAELAKVVNEAAGQRVALQKGKAFQVQRTSEMELYERTKRPRETRSERWRRPRRRRC
jgi:hypothetical protein